MRQSRGVLLDPEEFALQRPSQSVSRRVMRGQYVEIINTLQIALAHGSNNKESLLICFFAEVSLK